MRCSTRGASTSSLQYPAKDGSAPDSLYAFKGARETKTLGAITTEMPGRTQGEIASYGLGSIFYARVHPEGSSTEVLLLGKPTLNGQELCSDADGLLKSFQYWCVDTTVSNGEPLLPSLRGKEEAETVRGVLLELSQPG